MNCTQIGTVHKYKLCTNTKSASRYKTFSIALQDCTQYQQKRNPRVVNNTDAIAQHLDPVKEGTEL